MSLEALNSWLMLMTLLVIVGVALEGREYWDDFTEHGLRPLIPKLGYGLVVVGLSGELVFQTWIGHADSVLRDQSERQVAALTTANLVLEKAIAPRELTSEQQKAFVNALAGFDGAKISLVSYSLDAESARFGQQLLDAFNAAHLVIDDERMSEFAMGNIAFGVHVTGVNKELVDRLVLAFRQAALDVTTEPVPSPIISHGGSGIVFPAKVFVAVKPIPK